jgi:hypothetical protein
LAYCSDSLEQRNYIETVCQLGQKQKWNDFPHSFPLSPLSPKLQN